MADLHAATVIADVDLLDTVEFPVRKAASAGLLKATFAKFKAYLLASAKIVQFSDVDVTTPPTDGQALVWNATASKFKPGSVSSGGGGGGGTTATVNPSVVQYASAVGANGSVTFGAVPTPGNLLVAVGTHWNNNIGASSGWSQLVMQNGSSQDGTIIATKVVTDDTVTVSPWGAVNSTCVTVFEVKDWNGSTFQPFNYKQETPGTALTANFGVPITGSLLVGASSTLSANAAPSSITGAGTVATTTTGATTSASPRQTTPFYSAGLAKGAKSITANYAVSANQYLSGVVICPDQTGGGIASGTAFPASPAANDLFFRTDRHMEYFYDGTRWLSKQLFHVAPVLPNATSYAATSANQNRFGVPKYGHADIYIEKIAAAYIIVGAGTTWTIGFNANIAASATVIGPINAPVVVSGNHTYAEANIGAVVAGLIDIDLTYTRTVGTGTLYPMPSVMYRLVG